MVQRKLVSEEDYRQALSRGRLVLAKAHVVSARYRADTNILTLVMSTGVEITADIRTLPILCDHVGEDLSDPVVTPGGDGLLFKSAAIEVGLPGILAAIRANEAHRGSKPSAR